MCTGAHVLTVHQQHNVLYPKCTCQKQLMACRGLGQGKEFQRPSQEHANSGFMTWGRMVLGGNKQLSYLWVLVSMHVLVWCLPAYTLYLEQWVVVLFWWPACVFTNPATHLPTPTFTIFTAMSGRARSPSVARTCARIRLCNVWKINRSLIIIFWLI